MASVETAQGSGKSGVQRGLTLIHRWTGLAIGLWIALVALSGIGMVFSTTFWAWEFGEDKVTVAMQDRPYVGPDQWLAKAEARYGKLPDVEGYFGPRATPMRISAPTIVYTPPGTHKHGIVTVDPYTGEPLAKFVADDGWAFIPLWLHLSLFLGEDVSPWVLLGLSILLFGFGVSGLVLWWPGRGRFRAAASITKPRTPVSLRRFHAAIGFWLSPLILLAGFTGLLLSQFDVQQALIAKMGVAKQFDPATTPPGRCAAPRDITASEALARAQAAFPGRELASLFHPFEGNGIYIVWMRPAGSTVPARGDSEAIIDARCGTLLLARGADEMRTGDMVQSYLVELHNGRLLGLFGEALIFLQGLGITVLPVAGIALWLWKRRRRRQSPFTPQLQPAE